MNIHRFSYSDFCRDFGPYLEVRFYNYSKKKIGHGRRAIIDSGSNNIVIPYSVGREIKLDDPESLEGFENLDGVGGKVSFIKRNCIIYLIHSGERKMYGFWKEVAWQHPKDIDIRKKLEKMEKSLEEGGGDKERNKIKDLIDHFESSVILGRPFFNDLEYVKFCQNDRDSYFEYEIKQSRIDRGLIKNYPDDIQKLTE